MSDTQKFLVLESVKRDGQLDKPNTIVELTEDQIAKFKPSLFNRAYGSIDRADIKARAVKSKSNKVNEIQKIYDELAASRKAMDEEQAAFERSMKYKKDLADRRLFTTKKQLDAAMAALSEVQGDTPAAELETAEPVSNLKPGTEAAKKDRGKK